MGHKVHPIGFRLGVIYSWQSKWYADKNYTELLHEDLRLRRRILAKLSDAAVSRVELERNANQVIVTIHTAKPGIVIGRGGQKVDELRTELREDDQPPHPGEHRRDPSARARCLPRRAVRRGPARAPRGVPARDEAGGLAHDAARCSRREDPASAAVSAAREMSRRETEKDGRVPLHTLRADIDFGHGRGGTTFGRIGVKAWIYRGDVMPGATSARCGCGSGDGADGGSRCSTPMPGAACGEA